MIGKGIYGEVYKGILYGKEVAIKKFTIQQIDEETLKSFQNEVNLMR